MKIALTDPQIDLPNPVSREVSSPKLAQMLISILAEEDPEKYRALATKIHQASSPDHEHEETYNCLHPDWFGDIVGIFPIDSVTCSFCAYAHACSLGTDNRPTVAIVPLLGTSLPEREVLVDVFERVSNSSDMPYDPYIGFSHRAGKPRNIYAIEYSRFLKSFPESLVSTFKPQYAVGYDRSSGVSLWPQDHAFLEVFEQLNKQNLEHFEEIKTGSKGTLSRLETNLVLEVCHDNNWIMPSDDGRTEGRMLDFFSGVRHFLSTSSLFGPLSELANSSAIPGVDHPHPVGASRWMHLALRWMELQPHTFHRLLCEAYPDAEIPKSIKTSSLNYAQMDPGKTRYIPRFPAVVLIPKNTPISIKLELGACRIIDVHEYRGRDIVLLLDSLGLSLEDEL